MLSFVTWPGSAMQIVRVFSAPQSFLDAMKAICNVELNVASTQRPVGATVPALGLSNKARARLDVCVRVMFAGDL